MTYFNSITYQANSWILIDKATGLPKRNADETVKFYATWEEASQVIRELKVMGYYFQAVPLA